MKIILSMFFILFVTPSFASDVCCTPTPGTSYCLMIKKSTYKVTLCSTKGFLEDYSAVFGKAGLGDKEAQGDNKTPEGVFQITNIRNHQLYDKFLDIDYPNKQSQEKFEVFKQNEERKSAVRAYIIHQIPLTKNKDERAELIDAKNGFPKIGGSIGIHGNMGNGPSYDVIFDKHNNITNGCIAVRNPAIEHFAKILPIGTLVEIRP